jgi:foldase protein PrsA
LENENNIKKKTPIGLIIGIVAAVVIIAVGGVVFALKPWAGDYVAKVGDLTISKQEYMVFSKFNKDDFLKNNQITETADKYKWTTTKVDGEIAEEKVRKNTLESIQEIKIQIIKAKEAGIKLTDEELKQIDDTMNKQGDIKQTEKAIKETYGITLAEYKEVYKDFALAQKFYTEQQKNSKLKATDDEIKKYYDDNKKSYDKVTVTHVLFKTIDSNNAPVSEGKKSEAKTKAEDILKQVKAGANIKDLAEKYSEDKDQSGKVNNKGEYTFSKGEMVPQFEDWAFADHKSGDAGIVETSYGYHVMQFQKRVETPFADVKEKIRSSLDSKAFIDDFNKKLESWKKDKKFEIVKNESVMKKVDSQIYGG